MEKKPDEGTLPINRAEALDRIGGDPDFLKELLGIYSEEFVLKAKELRAAIDGQEFQTIQELGHSLKGSSANLSLPGLRQAAMDIETAGREKNIQKAKESFACLEKEFERLKKYLAQSPD
jgi:HPt (histidine-containing phosphotransfer) domain-containing protein